MIAPLQKQTLGSDLKPTKHDSLGRPLRDLRLSVIDACNLRCQYCLPAEVFGESFRFMPKEQLLSFDELTHIAETFVGLGVSKIRITGGEPLLRPNLPELVSRLRTIDDSLDLALTTNGLQLAAQAQALKDAGLDRLNVSLDALDIQVAQAMAGRIANPQRVLDAIEVARSVGFSVKVNAVIKRGVNESEILPLVHYAREHDLELRFIEYMDVGTRNHWQRDEVVTGAEIRSIIESSFKLEPMKVDFGAVARRYRYMDGSGVVGFIESISKPFCGDCSRARVSAEGDLFTCLFASQGVPLKPLLQRNVNLSEHLAELWNRRKDRYSELRKDSITQKTPHEEMWRLGG